MKKSLLFSIMLAFAMHFSIMGSNVLVENVGLVNQDITAGTNDPANFTHIKFDVSWENSWRTDKGPGNWDAVWVFAKILPYGEFIYKHATLSTVSTDHKVNTTNGVDYIIQPSADGKGVFMYRKNNSTPGSINWDNVELRWIYSNEGILDTTSVTVQVFAVEMVYIPEGSFYIGDGDIAGYGSTNSFRVNNKASTSDPRGREPYLVTSEGAITFEHYNSTSVNGVYDPTMDNGYTLPADFPKGFAAYYCMKYEVSQKQYVDFFNNLPKLPTTSPQKPNRNLANTGNFRNDFTWSPATTITDATTGSNSGDRAQNYLGWADACAYADWAALRPMSELEYEKACRIHDVDSGAIYPVKYGYPWGNTNIYNLTTGLLTNDGTSSEGINPSTSDANALYSGGVAGPVRNGIFAAKNATTLQRQQSGASFYGVMELAGNLAELVVSATIPYYSDYCPASQHLFTKNIHGDGNLSSNGNCNVPTWSDKPNAFTEVISHSSTTSGSANYCYSSTSTNSRTYANISKLRGGSFLDSNTILRTSDRSILPYAVSIVNYGLYATTNFYNRYNYVGFRAVRTAP